jgi:hypothetical protein
LNRWLYFLTNGKDTGQDAFLSQLDDPEFKEAVKVIKGYTTKQKLRRAHDMRENYKRLVNEYIYLEILCTFGATLEAESKDLEPKVRTVVQSNFWDLV